jgi:hypothetical protein
VFFLFLGYYSCGADLVIDEGDDAFLSGDIVVVEIEVGHKGFLGVKVEVVFVFEVVGEEVVLVGVDQRVDIVKVEDETSFG